MLNKIQDEQLQDLYKNAEYIIATPYACEEAGHYWFRFSDQVGNPIISFGNELEPLEPEMVTGLYNAETISMSFDGERINKPMVIGPQGEYGQILNVTAQPFGDEASIEIVNPARFINNDS